MKSLPEGYKVDLCWGELSEDQLRLVAAFLQADALKDPEKARAQAKLTAALAYAPDGTICAHMSVEPRLIKQLFNKFWTVAVYVHPDHRRHNLPGHLNLQLRNFFEARFKAGQDLDIIGWYMAMQSPVYQKHRTAAITENTGMVFVGRNRLGHQFRTFYFEGARIEHHFDTLPPPREPDKPVESARIEICWDQRTTELQQSVAQFLQREGALKDADQAVERARHTVAVAYDVDGEIVAEISAQSREIGQLDNRFWYVALYVSPRQRHSSLSSDLMLAARDHLEARFKAGHDPEVIGIFLVMQTRAYTSRRNLAVTRSGMQFVGRNKRGDNMRVYYFEGAHIDLSHIEGRVN